MTRPTSVTISGQPFTIETVELGGDEVGRTLVREQRVLIGSQAHLQERETVLHEIIHAVLQMAGHDIKEGAVTATGSGLLAVLRGNPELVEWLTEEVR